MLPIIEINFIIFCLFDIYIYIYDSSRRIERENTILGQSERYSANKEIFCIFVHYTPHIFYNFATDNALSTPRDIPNKYVL